MAHAQRSSLRWSTVRYPCHSQPPLLHQSSNSLWRLPECVIAIFPALTDEQILSSPIAAAENPDAHRTRPRLALDAKGHRPFYSLLASANQTSVSIPGEFRVDPFGVKGTRQSQQRNIEQGGEGHSGEGRGEVKKEKRRRWTRAPVSLTPGISNVGLMLV
jgi:hypothetical protein